MLVRAGYPIQKLPMANVALVRDDEASPVLGVVADYEQRGTEMQAVFLRRFDMRALTYDLAREPIVSLRNTQDYFIAQHNGICHFRSVANGAWTAAIYEYVGETYEAKEMAAFNVPKHLLVGQRHWIGMQSAKRF